MKNLAILGSTGSIGTQTLDIVRETGEYKVISLTAKSSIELLAAQINEFRPQYVCLYDSEKKAELNKILNDKYHIANVEIMTGMDGLITCATCDETDMVVSALVGMIGIRPTIEAIKAGKDIAFANKETLVCAGHIIMPLVKEKCVKFLPVDSEHSAIFQSLMGNSSSEPEQILLTASGGPFRGYSRKQLENVTVKDALKHPNWSMGRKITIDSASMVNKCLELIEAKWLFGVPAEKIKILIHPESIIHSMVEYKDGAVIAQLGLPNMKVPIAFALGYPCRHALNDKKINFADITKLTFYDPDVETFNMIKLAYRICDSEGLLPTVFNAANEFAVAKFLAGEIAFMDIYRYISTAVESFEDVFHPTLEQILDAEKKTYIMLESL